MSAPAFTIPLAAVLLAAPAANYSARVAVVDGIETVQLADAARRVRVSIVPSLGNVVYEMKVGDRNVLWFPYATLADFKAHRSFCGIPFLAPWANRLDGDAFWVNGKRYCLNGALGNLRRDGRGKPLHGLLSFSPYWKVAAIEGGPSRARVTSRLEFWQHPDLMAQFPFAHTIEMTHCLRDGVLEVETVLENLSRAPMPVAVGYHPYVRLPGIPRDSWHARLPVRERFVLSDELIPTGERRPVAAAGLRLFPGTPQGEAYTDLVRGEDGKAEFQLEGGGVRVAVTCGPRYRVALVYAPPGAGFVCFEPMTAPADGFNLAHAGKYAELQTVPPGGRWRERFAVAASGL